MKLSGLTGGVGWLNPGRRLAIGAWRGREGGRSGFGMRLFVAHTLSVVLVGGSGYLLLDRALRHWMVEQYATLQQADARSIEASASEAGSSSPSTPAPA